MEKGNDEVKALRAALLQAVHDLGCLAAALQLAAPNDPMVPFGYRMMENARSALVVKPVEKARKGTLCVSCGKCTVGTTCCIIGGELYHEKCYVDGGILGE